MIIRRKGVQVERDLYVCFYSVAFQKRFLCADIKPPCIVNTIIIFASNIIISITLRGYNEEVRGCEFANIKLQKQDVGSKRPWGNTFPCTAVSLKH